MLAKYSIAQEHEFRLILEDLGLIGKFGLLTLLKFSTFIVKWLHLL